MSINSAINRADSLLKRVENTLGPEVSKLSNFLESDRVQNVDIFKQTDGWCLLVDLDGEPLNVPVGSINEKDLYSMDLGSALEYLEKRAI